MPSDADHFKRKRGRPRLVFHSFFLSVLSAPFLLGLSTSIELVIKLNEM